MSAPTVLIATWRDGVFSLTDGTFHHEWPGRSVTGLARAGNGEALAILDGKSLCQRAADGGWETIATSQLDLACCIGVGADIYVGINDAAQVMRVRDDGRLERLRSFDHVPGRERWYPGTALVDGRVIGPPLGIRSMAASCDGRTLFANVHVGGIPRSTDGGATWRPTIDVDSDVHQVCTHPTRPEIVIAATAIGLGISRDGGETWAIERNGLHATYCSAVAFLGDDMLVAASADHFAPQGAVYRRPLDGGGPLRPVAGLPRWLDGISDTGNISVCEATLAVADRAGNLHLSMDAGDSWSRQLAVIPTPSSVLVC